MTLEKICQDDRPSASSGSASFACSLINVATTAGAPISKLIRAKISNDI